MLRLYLRMYLIQFTVFAIALVGLHFWIEHFFDEERQIYSYEMGRGSFEHLAEGLRGKTLDQQYEQLRVWQPDYGLLLSLVDSHALVLNANEQVRLDQGKFFGREKYTVFYVPIDWSRQQELLSIQVKPPPNDSEFCLNLSAYSFMAVIGALWLYLWIRPHWRELQTLQRAAHRFGNGDLSARAEISRRSSLRDLAGQFNVMATQIESLIASRRDLSNAISHELRTPMARLSFELDAAHKLDDPAAWRTLVGNMRQDLTELEALVSELLSLARLEYAHNSFVQEPTLAQDWLDSVVAMVAVEAEARGVSCVVLPGALPYVRLDARQMARALINVVRNAVYHARSRVEVRLREDEEHFVLSVDDDGHGIPEVERTRVFEPFIRLDSSRSRETGGFGLGLAIVQQIVKSHQGEVWVEDSPLGGARVVIRWRA